MLRSWTQALRCFCANAYTVRSHTCAELGANNIGEKVSVVGWLSAKRMNRFLLLRDGYGTVQATLPTSSSLCAVMDRVPCESVIQVQGTVVGRGKDVNPNMKTGQVEISVEEVTLLNEAASKMPLFPDANASERTRLRYRYIDLRSGRMQHALRLRSHVIHNMRKFLVEQCNFVDVETPTLFRRTPGGAAEFIVPAPQPNLGTCYSLPQSPQQFKQLLMVGAIDRYFQVARCYRNEGAKLDRQPEFTQLDLEMSFTNEKGVMNLVEDVVVNSWPEHLEEHKPTAPFPCLTFEEVMKKYGSDKPDLRFDWQIEDCTELLQPLNSSQRRDFAARVIVARGQANTKMHEKEWRKILQINDKSTNFVIFTSQSKRWFNFTDNSEIIDKFSMDQSDALIVAWGASENVQWTLGQLRNLVATAGGLRQQKQFCFHWIVDFPLFEKENGRIASTHHPFTAPKAEHLELIEDEDKLPQITGQHYDLVMNGQEVGGGSIRIHNAQLQRRVLDILGESSEQLVRIVVAVIFVSVNHLLDALSHGAPPHGGFAFGLDRYISILNADGDATQSLRDVIAFPKSKEGRDVMSNSPAPVSEDDLRMYGIRFDVPKQEAVNE